VRGLIAVLAATLGLAALASPAGAFVYWSNTNGGLGSTIGRANPDGSAPDQAFISGLNGPRQMAVDRNYIYWANGTSIGRAKRDGTDVQPQFISISDATIGVAVDQNYIYWTQGGSPGWIGRANLDGSGVDPNFISDPDGNPHAVAVTADHIYWVRLNQGSIGRANIDGSGADPNFLAFVGTAFGIAVDDAHIYWTDGYLSTIDRANLDGTGLDRSFIQGVSNPAGIAVDDAHIYWTSFDGNIARANIDGSGLDPTFITGATAPQGVTVDPRAKSTLALTASPDSAVSGQLVDFAATVTVNPPDTVTPQGSVSFSNNGVPIPGCESVALVDQVAHCSIRVTVANPPQVTASYPGNDEVRPASTSTPVTVTVSRASTETGLVSSKPSVVVGESVTYTATPVVLAPGTGTPTGTVSFTDNGNAISGCQNVPLSGGSATCTTTYASVAGSPHSIVASYSGDTELKPSAGTLSQAVTRTPTQVTTSSAGLFATTITVSPKPPGTGTPTGTVTYTQFNLLGLITSTRTVPLVNGRATVSTINVGGRFTATYSGDANYLPSSTSLP